MEDISKYFEKNLKFDLIFNKDKHSTIVICNWCTRPGEGILTINFHGQFKKFCTETCFSKWRRSIFKFERICDSCKKDMKNVLSPFFYHLKEYNQYFQYCSYICFLSFKELLSYNMVRSNPLNKIINNLFTQNMFYSMIKQESEEKKYFDFNMMENRLNLKYKKGYEKIKIKRNQHN